MATTPEGWFRTRKKDFYVISRIVDKGKSICDLAFDLCTDDYFKEADILFEWFATYLPNVTIDYCLASEYSGIILGPSSIVADFDENSLTLFKNACSSSDFGWTVDYQLLYDDWLNRISTCRLLPAPMSAQQRARWWDFPRQLFKSRSSLVPQQQVMWWDTPEGFVFVSTSNKNKLPSEADAWWIYLQHDPKMNGIQFNNYPHGTFDPKRWRSSCNIWISYDDNNGETWSSKAYIKDQERIRLLRAALGLIEKDPVEIMVGWP